MKALVIINETNFKFIEINQETLPSISLENHNPHVSIKYEEFILKEFIHYENNLKKPINFNIYIPRNFTSELAEIIIYDLLESLKIPL